MDMHEEIRGAAEYDRAAIDAGVLKDAHAIWGDEGLKRKLHQMGPVRAAKAELILKRGSR